MKKWYSQLIETAFLLKLRAGVKHAPVPNMRHEVGSGHTMNDGTTYVVMPNGEWRKIKDG